MCKEFCLTICFLFAFVTSLSAQTKRVLATGNWEIANITPEAAKEKAIEVAKANALQKAGVSELFTVINANSVSDRINYFVSSSRSELSGEIKKYQIIKEQILTEGTHLFYTVDIEAEVRIKRNKKDLEFDAYIEGIKETPYQDGENLIFSIRPTKACYAHIFWFDERGNGNIVYPNQAEGQQLLNANQSNAFPVTQDYKIRKETESPIESMSLILVLTKKNVPYTRKVTLEDFYQWVLLIPSDLRVIKSYNVYITR